MGDRTAYRGFRWRPVICRELMRRGTDGTVGEVLHKRENDYGALWRYSRRAMPGPRVRQPRGGSTTSGQRFNRDKGWGVCPEAIGELRAVRIEGTHERAT